MHPTSVTHLGVDYQLRHLAQHFGEFNWTAEDKQQIAFSIRVRYSTHCYSELSAGPFSPGSYTVPDGNGRRIFCPIRHGHSLGLPAMINGLFAKPTTPVGLTSNENWSMYRLAVQPPLAAGQRYYVFFRVKASGSTHHKQPPYWLDLFVESAYAKNQKVTIRRQFPFGRVAERTAKGLRL